jgi:hypothetical protein
MYPIIAFFPLVVVMAYQGMRERGFNPPRPLINITKGVVAIFNILCLVIFVFFSDKFLFDSKIFCDSDTPNGKTKGRSGLLQRHKQ